MMPTAFYGAIAAGAAVSASQPSVTPAELARQLNLTSSKLLICTAELKSLALDGAKQAGLPADRVLYLGDGHDFSLSVAATDAPVPISTTLLDWRRIASPSALRSTPAAFVYSSGTTGLPKAVILSHANMVSQTVLVVDNIRAHNPLHVDFDYRTLAHLPAAHIAGLQGYFVNPAYIGGPVYWMRRFDFPQFLAYCKRYAITSIFSVPPVYLAIAKSPIVKDQLDSIQMAMSGAAPLGRDIQAAARKKLGKGSATLGQTWGLSETSGGFTLMPRGWSDDTGSVSMILPNCEARIVDDKGQDVRPGERGEMLVRGPIVTQGYLKNEKANAEAFVDGWFCTGDICLLKDGKIYCVDRKKVSSVSIVGSRACADISQELIKYKGSQVAPAELEALLVTNPLILDAAVIGVDQEGTEVPRYACVDDRIMRLLTSSQSLRRSRRPEEDYSRANSSLG
jgi:4-coumarate--CoA ligase